MSRKSKLFNTAQLCLIWDISRVTLQAWINEGMPIADKDDSSCGSPRNLFDWQEVNAWLNDHPKKSARLMNSAAAKSQVDVKPLTGDYFLPDDPNQAELLEIERRLQQAEKLAFSQYANAQNDKKGVAVIEKFQKNWLAITDRRMKFETQFASQLKNVRCKVSGVSLDLSRLSTDDQKLFNELITKAEA